VLAKALTFPDPEHCSLDHLNQPVASLAQTVDAYLRTQDKSEYTIRNIKSNLRRLFRLAESHQLFTPLPVHLTPRYDCHARPPRRGTNREWARHYHLYVAQWPPDLQQAYHDFVTWATAPLVTGRDASLRKRESSMRSYRDAFEAYFGFLHYIRHLAPLTFDHLFDSTLITAFVHWHVNELHHRTTLAIRYHLQRFITLTKQYRPLPDVRTHLLALLRTLPLPHPLYNKEEAWVSMDTLERIGCELWPRSSLDELRQKPHNSGRKAAFYAGLSLMLRLWRYVPLRQRNMREMRLKDNLYQDVHGLWHITFRGDELKIATKRGKLNVFDVYFPETLVPVLEDYLRVWRPLLLTDDQPSSSRVFLASRGVPYTEIRLRTTTKAIVYRYTGQCWHPHITRTVWTTEWIRNSGDFHTAAVMLNDRLDTVIARYTHLLEEDVAQKAYKLIDARHGQGT
jgi:hypothetical protein